MSVIPSSRGSARAQSGPVAALGTVLCVSQAPSRRRGVPVRRADSRRARRQCLPDWWHSGEHRDDARRRGGALRRRRSMSELVKAACGGAHHHPRVVYGICKRGRYPPHARRCTGRRCDRLVDPGLLGCGPRLLGRDEVDPALDGNTDLRGKLGADPLVEKLIVA